MKTVFIIISLIWCLCLVGISEASSVPPLSFWTTTHYYNTTGVVPFPDYLHLPTNYSQFKGEIKVCSFQVYGYPGNPIESYELYNVAGILMWAYVVNNLRSPNPGIQINETSGYYYVNVTTINVGFDSATTQAICSRALDNKEWGDFDIYIAPWASLKALDIAPCTERNRKPFITSWCSLPSAYICPATDFLSVPGCTKASDRRFKYMWGLIATADTYWDPALNLLKLKGASTFAVWAVNDTYILTTFGGAELSAKRNGYTVLTPPLPSNKYPNSGDWNVVPVNTVILLPSIDQLTAVFKRMIDLDPDVLLNGNRIPPTCADIVTVMQQLNYAPRAVGASQCLSFAQNYPNADMRYFLDYSVWDVNVHGIGYLDTGSQDWKPLNGSSSSSHFNETYLELFGQIPNWYAVGTYMAGYAFETALGFAGSLDPEILNKNFQFTLETTFFGTLGYNSYGYNDKFTLLVVQQDLTNHQKIVYPSGTATSDLIFPFVSWSARTFQTSYLGVTSEKVIFALFVLCVIYSFICLILLIRYWHSRSVEASSPTFLTIMLAGSFLLYATVPSWMIHVDESGASCHLRFWFLCFGFTLLFGTLVAKTHRIQSLFFLKKMRPKKFTDTKLLRYVGIMIAIDVFLCILWSAITRPERYKVIRDGLGTENGYIWENNNFVDCKWDKTPGAMTAFLALEGTYKTIMVAYGLYLSVSLWKYGSSMWVESKQIIFSMYNLIVFALIGLALQLSLGYTKDRPTLEVLFVTRSVCILISGVITIAAILVPRLYDPDGKSHEGKDTVGTKRTIDTAAIQLSDLEFKYEMMEKKYRELKKKYREVCPDEKLSEDAEE